MAVGHRELDGFTFDLNAPYTFCRICGAIFQTKYDRRPQDFSTDHATIEDIKLYATSLRVEWSHIHANSHPEKQHRQLIQSGLFATPEAAHILAAYGIIAISDMVLDSTSQDALQTAPRAPVEGFLKESL